jgi:hypothetical protein
VIGGIHLGPVRAAVGGLVHADDVAVGAILQECVEAAVGVAPRAVVVVAVGLAHERHAGGGGGGGPHAPEMDSGAGAAGAAPGLPAGDRGHREEVIGGGVARAHEGRGGRARRPGAGGGLPLRPGVPHAGEEPAPCDECEGLHALSSGPDGHRGGAHAHSLGQQAGGPAAERDRGVGGRQPNINRFLQKG